MEGKSHTSNELVISVFLTQIFLTFRCGYVLKPDCTRLEDFNPYDTGNLEDVKPITVNLTVNKWTIHLVLWNWEYSLAQLERAS